MHPALSIIVFTTASGLGYGLAAMLGLGLLDPAALATKIAHLLALALISGGLLSSLLHLGNPQRAWRALSQWRSSWLSREGVMAILTFAPLVWSASASILEGRYLPLPGIAGTLMCAVTVYCTSMIYGSLKSVQAWHTPLTPACYLLFSAAGGLLLASVFALASGKGAGVCLLVGAAFVVAAWVMKLRWWRRLDETAPLSTPESATGLGAIGRVRLFERPHVNENYLTREMGYRIARKHADKLRRIALLAGGALPLLFAVSAAITNTAPGIVLAAAASLSFTAGILVERWLFFATARHAVMNYY